MPSTKQEIKELSKIVIEPFNNEWQIWIPPSRPEHRDEAGNDIGPYGITYFPTLTQAIFFLASIARELTEDGWTPNYLPIDV